MKLEDNLSNIDRVNNLLSIAPVSMDFITSLCGEHIGSGTTRAVYEYNLDRRFVIKVEPLNSGCNFTEYMMWEEIQGLQGNLAWVKEWFAPVKWISPNGRLLVMQRTTEKPKKERPAQVPAFLWDVAWRNFGWIGNKFVCHDYGQFYNFISYGKKMQKIEWYKHESGLLE